MYNEAIQCIMFVSVGTKARLVSALRNSVEDSECLSQSDTDLSVDPRHESMALKVFKDSKIQRQTSVVLGNHGDVTSVVAGSIKVTIVVKTVADLQQLLHDIDTGCIQHRFKQWIMSHDKHFDHACAVKAEVTPAERASARNELEYHNILSRGAGRNLLVFVYSSSYCVVQQNTRNQYALFNI